MRTVDAGGLTQLSIHTLLLQSAEFLISCNITNPDELVGIDFSYLRDLFNLFLKSVFVSLTWKLPILWLKLETVNYEADIQNVNCGKVQSLVTTVIHAISQHCCCFGQERVQWQWWCNLCRFWLAGVVDGSVRRVGGGEVYISGFHAVHYSVNVHVLMYSTFAYSMSPSKFGFFRVVSFETANGLQEFLSQKTTLQRSYLSD